jgi:hypothetical protein
MSSPVAKVWTFPSSSNPTKNYETLQYTDDTTSCNCPGWTRRVAADGSRTCKHTRLVDQGLADSEATSYKDYTGGTKATAKGTTHAKAKKTVMESSDPMDKDLKDLDKNWETKRKIRWK